jgi:acylglycerol lipase
MKVVAVVLMLAAFLSACAPMVQKPLKPTPSFVGPHLTDDSFVSFDGARLGLSHWDPPQGAQPWAVIVGLHGMDDYANAFHLAGPFWARQGIATYAYDQRGYGRSPERGVWAGDKLYEDDLRTFTRLIRRRFPQAVVAVVAESLGGAVAIETFASDQPPDADRLVLLAPAVWGWSSQPLAYKLALIVTAHVIPNQPLNPPSFVTDHIWASDNIPELIAMGRDPLMMYGATPGALFGLVTTMQHASDDIGRLKVPTLYAMGAHDEIIPKQPAIAAAARLPAGARTAYYAQGWHLLLRDKERETVLSDIASFIRDPAAPLPSGAPPVPTAVKPSSRSQTALVAKAPAS